MENKNNGFCAIPDEIMKSIMKNKKLSREIRILFAIFWFTLRRGRVKSKIQKTKIEEITGIKNQNIKQALISLCGKNIIEIYGKTGNVIEVLKINPPGIEKNQSPVDGKLSDLENIKINPPWIEKNQSPVDGKMAPYSRVFSREKNKRDFSQVKKSLISFSFFNQKGFLLSNRDLLKLEQFENTFSAEIVRNALNLIDLYYANTNTRIYVLSFKFDVIMKNLQLFIDRSKVEEKISREKSAFLEMQKKSGQSVDRRENGELSIEEQLKRYGGNNE